MNSNYGYQPSDPDPSRAPSAAGPSEGDLRQSQLAQLVPSDSQAGSSDEWLLQAWRDTDAASCVLKSVRPRDTPPTGSSVTPRAHNKLAKAKQRDQSRQTPATILALSTVLPVSAWEETTGNVVFSLPWMSIDSKVGSMRPPFQAADDSLDADAGASVDRHSSSIDFWTAKSFVDRHLEETVKCLAKEFAVYPPCKDREDSSHSSVHGQQKGPGRSKTFTPYVRRGMCLALTAMKKSGRYNVQASLLSDDPGFVQTVQRGTREIILKTCELPGTLVSHMPTYVKGED